MCVRLGTHAYAQAYIRTHALSLPVTQKNLCKKRIFVIVKVTLVHSELRLHHKEYINKSLFHFGAL